jgi:hypothetical protein
VPLYSNGWHTQLGYIIDCASVSNVLMIDV